MKIKICGIRRAEDALLAADAGADAIGILHGQQHPSPDFVDFQTAQSILTVLPPFVSGVLVTHISNPQSVLQMIEKLGVATVQIHSNMTPDGVSFIRKAIPTLRILKSCHVIGEQSLKTPIEYLDLVDGFVLDTFNPVTGQVGGSGITHNWGLSRKLIQAFPNTHFILAGGLTASNVEQAISATKPYAVDVNSGTKGQDGYKSAEKIRLFVEAVRASRE